MRIICYLFKLFQDQGLFNIKVFCINGAALLSFPKHKGFDRYAPVNFLIAEIS